MKGINEPAIQSREFLNDFGFEFIEINTGRIGKDNVEGDYAVMNFSVRRRYDILKQEVIMRVYDDGRIQATFRGRVRRHLMSSCPRCGCKLKGELNDGL